MQPTARSGLVSRKKLLSYFSKGAGKVMLLLWPGRYGLLLCYNTLEVLSLGLLSS